MRRPEDVVKAIRSRERWTMCPAPVGSYRLGYVRGPEGIIVALAEELS